MELKHIPWPGWELVREIGKGTFGTVYEIKHDLITEEERAALKVLSVPQNESDIKSMRSEGMTAEEITQTVKEQAGKILQEYKSLCDLQGAPNIVRCNAVHHETHADGIGVDVYILMELLTPLLDNVDVLLKTESQIISFGIDMCNALIACEKKKILHRDIKPENIFVSQEGIYKLGDFGVARSHDHTTYATRGVGTPSYMAPEIANGGEYNKQADIYSLGIVLYWLLNKRRTPFLPLPPHGIRMSDREKALERRCAGEAIPAPVNGSKELKRIVLKACAFDAADRYQSAAELLADLNALSGVPAAVVPPVKDMSEINSIPYGDYAEEDATVGPVPGNVTTTVDTDKTVGPVFNPVPADEILDQDKTVGPVFAPEKKTDSSSKNKKVWPVIAGLLIAAVILLLTQCDSGPPKQLEWSEWMDTLPDYATDEFYNIEEQILYRSRNLETTTSTTQSEMAGWELYDAVEGNGEFGGWSEWSASEVTGNETREVETETRYHYRDKETTSNSESAMSGWELADTTYTWGEYGGWSDWSTSAVSGSDSRKVETKKQYQYRNITYTTEYTGWSSWSSWGNDYVSETDLREVKTRTAYHYYYFICSNCGKHLPGKNLCYSWDGGCGKSNTGTSYTTLRSTTPYSSTSDFGGVGMRYITLNGDKVFAYTSSSSQHYRAPITQYQYRTRSTQQVANYGSWSSWGDTAYSSSSSREVKTRTQYRYCDREQIPTYHFWRWGSWTDWSVDAVSASDNRQVETTLYYRYRDRQRITTYFFRRWGDWSEYSTQPIEVSDTVETEKKTQYRFKSKNS